MKLFLKHSLSSCDGGWSRGGRWRIKLKCVGREAGRWFVFTSESSCANFGAAICSIHYVRRCLSFFFYLFLCALCIWHVLVAIWWQSELIVSTLLFFASHFHVYYTLIRELKPDLNTEEPYVENNKGFGFFSVLNLILALTIPSVTFQKWCKTGEMPPKWGMILQSHD